MPMYDEISAGAVLHLMDKNFEINYLILNYSYGHWDFPKGNIESGETEIETIKREVMEETGISRYKINRRIQTTNFLQIQKEIKIGK